MGKAMWMGKETGKVKESGWYARVQGAEKQSGTEVCLFHAPISPKFCGFPLVCMDKLPQWIRNPR